MVKIKEHNPRYLEAMNYIMETRGMTLESFAESLGVGRTTLSQVRRGAQNASTKVVVRTCEVYPEVNANYILTGSGSMLNQEKIEQKTKQEIINNAKPLDARIIIQVPLVNQYAYAGYLSGYQTDTYIDSLPTIPFIADHEMKGNYIAFEVKGDSMNDGTEESYLEGDKLFCREIPQHLWVDSKLHIRKWDFVIVHEEGILIKRIIDHDVQNHTITVHSLNDFYPDKVIDLADVRQIFNVVEMQRPKRR